MPWESHLYIRQVSMVDPSIELAERLLQEVVHSRAHCNVRSVMLFFLLVGVGLLMLLTVVPSTLCVGWQQQERSIALAWQRMQSKTAQPLIRQMIRWPTRQPYSAWPSVQPKVHHHLKLAAASRDIVSIRPSGDAAINVAPDQAQQMGEFQPWVCRSCGLSNEASNEICGATGPLGCKAPRKYAAIASLRHVPEAQSGSIAVASLRNASDHPSSCDFIGVLHSFGTKFGYISCAEIAAELHRDVYVVNEDLVAAFRRGIRSGTPVRFKLSEFYPWPPVAKKIRHAKLISKKPAPRFSGIVRNLSEAQGFGLIEYEIEYENASHHIGTIDHDASSSRQTIHVDLDLLRGYSLGQRVLFTLQLNQVDGTPRVQNLTAAGPIPKVLPPAVAGSASVVMEDIWKGGDVLIFGDGDLSFADAAAKLHPSSHIHASVYLDSREWHRRYPKRHHRVPDLEWAGHSVLFGVDATNHSCAKHDAVVFNFPYVSLRDAHKLNKSDTDLVWNCGELVFGFLTNAVASADIGTLIVLGLWDLNDGESYSGLYGQDAHDLVAGAIASSHEASHGKVLVDALTYGYERGGVRADYGFYEPYEKAGYLFRTSHYSAQNTMENQKWYSKACFLLRVVARQ